MSGRWRGRAVGLAAPARRERGPALITVDLLHVAVHNGFRLALLGILDVLIVLLVHLRVGSWEGRIDVLGQDLVLGSLTFLHASDVSLLKRSVFVQSSADEISGVW